MISSELATFVKRAAQELIAAEASQNYAAEISHMKLAFEFIELIKCGGDVQLYKLQRLRRSQNSALIETTPKRCGECRNDTPM